MKRGMDANARRISRSQHRTLGIGCQLELLAVSDRPLNDGNKHMGQLWGRYQRLFDHMGISSSCHVVLFYTVANKIAFTYYD